MISALAKQTHQSITPNNTQIHQTLMKVMYLGMALTLGSSLVLGLVGFLLRQNGAGATTPPEGPEQVLFYALLAVAVAELPTALFLKKAMLKPLGESGGATTAIPTTSYVFSRYLVLFNLAGACPVYGFVWYFLGGTLPEFVLFAAIGLVIFRLVRPTTEFFYSLFGVRPAIE
jgi:FtsH-binding integral membrane protein